MPVFFDKLLSKKWLILPVLGFVHGLIAFLYFLNVSPELTKLSFSRLFIVFLPCLWAFLNIYLFFFLRSNQNIDKFFASNNRDKILIGTILILALRCSLWYFNEVFAGDMFSRVNGYLTILSPVFDLPAYMAFELLILLVSIFFQKNKTIINIPGRGFVYFGIIFTALSLLVVTVSNTRLGISAAYNGDWAYGQPAVPILEWQIGLAILFCLGLIFLESRINIASIPYLELWICSIIWLATISIWLSQPVIPNPSALKPHEPNFEIYPFIDSQTYDQVAQRALIGNGLGENLIPQRPFYIVFLVISHLFAGQRYESLIQFQSLFFALFPVLLYIFGRDFFGRPVGMAIAVLAIFRDYISNFVSPYTGNLTYSKVFLSEIPTAMLLIIFLIIGIRWMRSGFAIYYGILMGGILGAAMLIRTQTVVVIPVIILFGVLNKPGNVKLLLKSILPMVVLTAFVVAPWLWRNWKMTGEFIFDNPESQTMNLALRYSWVNGVDTPVIARLPNETNAEFSSRLKQIAFDAISSNPFGAAWAVANSFLNHCINNILLFPLRNQIHDTAEFWIPANAFWESWGGHPLPFQKTLLAFYIFLFGLGVTVAWYRNGWIGLLPLALNLGYNLWTSIALLSGQRFMVTMDWSILLYYMIGIFSLIVALLFLFDRTRSIIQDWIKANPFSDSLSAPIVQLPQYILPGILFFAIGLSLPLTEKIFPQRYPHLSQEQLFTNLLASPSLTQSSVNKQCLQATANEAELTFVQGRALYPRYYLPDDGERFTDTPGYKPVNYGRLVFDIIGQANHRVIFPMEVSPDFFPHASDVTLIYNGDGELWFIFVKLDGNERFYVSDHFDLSRCN